MAGDKVADKSPDLNNVSQRIDVPLLVYGAKLPESLAGRLKLIVRNHMKQSPDQYEKLPLISIETSMSQPEPSAKKDKTPERQIAAPPKSSKVPSFVSFMPASKSSAEKPCTSGFLQVPTTSSLFGAASPSPIGANSMANSKLTPIENTKKAATLSPLGLFLSPSSPIGFNSSAHKNSASSPLATSEIGSLNASKQTNKSVLEAKNKEASSPDLSGYSDMDSPCTTRKSPPRAEKESNQASARGQAGARSNAAGHKLATPGLGRRSVPSNQHQIHRCSVHKEHHRVKRARTRLTKRKEKLNKRIDELRQQPETAKRNESLDRLKTAQARNEVDLLKIKIMQEKAAKTYCRHEALTVEHHNDQNGLLQLNLNLNPNQAVQKQHKTVQLFSDSSMSSMEEDEDSSDLME